MEYVCKTKCYYLTHLFEPGDLLSKVNPQAKPNKHFRPVGEKVKDTGPVLTSGDDPRSTEKIKKDLEMYGVDVTGMNRKQLWNLERELKARDEKIKRFDELSENEIKKMTVPSIAGRCKKLYGESFKIAGTNKQMALDKALSIEANYGEQN